ncbi:MAG: hypothetical protein EOO44_20785 [Flavobacterium sp.]|nr:MAG: hypothetical protein EOO44_20785 [Flavobacterium sp.]
MRKFVLLTLLIIQYSFTFGQITFSINEFDKGEFVGVKENYAILRTSPDTNSSVVDTIFDRFQNFSFEVLENSKDKDFIHIKTKINKWSNGAPDPKTGWYVMPKVIDDGIEAWVDKKEILKNPVPDLFTLVCYRKHPELLKIIANNADLKKSNDKIEYEKIYKSTHASAYLSLGTYFFSKDSVAEAIFFLTKSIEVLPKKRPYVIRAYAKKAMNDFQGAINDCNTGFLIETKIIAQNNPNFSYLTENDLQYDNIDFNVIRGVCYLELKNFNLAIINLTEAIKKDPKNGQLYYFRGIAKYNFGQKKAGCFDFSRAGEFGIKDAYNLIKQYCNQ